jgi:hypothetical protein
VRLIVERERLDRVVERLESRDPAVGEDARAAVEWLTGEDEDDAPANFTRRGLQLFLWYELPRKWLIEPDGHLAVAEALAIFFDELGPQAAGLAALCRDAETTRLLRAGGEGFVEAIEASGLEPLDSPLLEWSDLMTIEESLERDAAGDFLEEAVDDGLLIPGDKGWQHVQAELTERFLITPDPSGTTPLSRIHAARREAWLEMTADREQQALLEAATPLDADAPSLAEAAAAVEPLLWLLGRLADGVKLTQTGALPRALVREAVERYPDWWDTEVVGPPYREAEIYPLEVLHTIVDELELARRRSGILKLSPRGRALRVDPSALLSAIASMIAGVGSRQLDLTLADVVAGDDPSVGFPLLHLLGPFQGVIGNWLPEPPRLTPAGRTLAAAILHARAYGARHSFA